MKILIAEDDLTSRIMLEAVTRKWGYETISVEDGEAAWAVYQQPDAPQLLLLDWEMPKLSGFELCKKIRQQKTKKPPFIILLTARSETSDIVKGLSAGANDYIAKPFENAELQARLQVGQRMLELQKELHKTRAVMSMEKEAIENIIIKMQMSHPADLTHIQKLEIPVEKTSGDILLAQFRADGCQHIMLGDFTGHGLTAAIGGPIVSDIFYSMTEKGLVMDVIATEINHKLCEKMPTGLFCGAVFMEISANRRQLSVWNCGMENVLLYRGHELFHEISSDKLALGIIDKPIVEAITLTLEEGDRVYAYSDGITETINEKGDEFGEQELKQTLTQILLSGEKLSTLSKKIKQYRGHGEQLDDITLVELSC